MELTDSNDTMIPTDIIRAFNINAHDKSISFKDTIHVTEAPVDSETIHATVLTAHAHQFVFAFEIEVHVEIINVSTQTCP